MDNSNTKVIIVGNGSSLNGGKNQNLIDSFDKVIRLNKYLIKGYEEDVGHKTDVNILNARTLLHHFTKDDMIKRLKNIDEVCVIIRGDLELEKYFDIEFQGRVGRMAIDLINRHDNMNILDRELVHAFHDMLAIKTPCVSCERSQDTIITTGLYAIGKYIKEGYDVSIIGFDSIDLHMKFDELGWDVDTQKLEHYQGKGLLNIGLEHKVFAEARWLRGLVSLGIITRLDE